VKFLCEPLVHFLLVGTMLFGVFVLVGDRSRERAGQIVVTPGHLEHLMVSFTRTWQRPPTAPELAGLIEDSIREEVLYRETVAVSVDKPGKQHHGPMRWSDKAYDSLAGSLDEVDTNMHIGLPSGMRWKILPCTMALLSICLRMS
jgi:hypothetical protein